MTWFFDTREEACQAQAEAFDSLRSDPDWAKFAHPIGSEVYQCKPDPEGWTDGGIEALGEGDNWCVLDESGEWMVQKLEGETATWVNVA